MMASARWMVLGIVLCAALGASGCMHDVEFKRSGHPSLTTLGAGTISARVAVFKDQAGGSAWGDGRGGLVDDGVEEALQAAGGLVAAASPEYTVSIASRSRGAPRGWNFLISWPGFVVFAPAWHGLMWRYDVEATARVRHASGRELPPVRVGARYDVRHTALWEGVLIESGWLILYTIPAFVGGIVTSAIDPDLDTFDAEFRGGREARELGRELGRAAALAIQADAQALAAGAALARGSAFPSATAQAVAERPTQVEVRSTPPGAHVFIDDLYAGDTPVLVQPKPGLHRVALTLPGHESLFEEVEVGPSPLRVERRLAPVPPPEARRARPPAPPPPPEGPGPEGK